jgi:hypothetical protein
MVVRKTLDKLCEKEDVQVRSLVLAAASVDITVFWNVQCG